MPEKITVARKAEGMGGLAKGLAIVEAFATHDLLSIADAARATRTTRAAARRCLLTLADLGYVEQSGREFRPLARLRELTDRTGLSHRLGSKIQKLSGGERQRTALCRALMNKPRILLADEPTGSLDEQTSEIVFELLLEIVANEGVTLVMATHDRALAARCGRVIEMRDGRIDEPA